VRKETGYGGLVGLTRLDTRLDSLRRGRPAPECEGVRSGGAIPRERDVRLAATPDGRLRFDAPAGAVTPELRAALGVRRAQLLALVRHWRLPYGPLGVLLAEPSARADAGVSPADPAGPAADPRPDLGADSRAWAALLALASAQDGGQPDGVFGCLHGVRCLGARLARGERDRSLSPGEIAPAEWEALRREWLLSRRELVRTLLVLLAALPLGTRAADGDAGGGTTTADEAPKKGARRTDGGPPASGPIRPRCSIHCSTSRPAPARGVRQPTMVR
jgi:hypothetical protein